jgi:hypothetical protein
VALLAAQTLSEASIETCKPVLEIREPRSSEVYPDLYRAYRELYTATRDIAHALAAPPER